MVPEATPAPSGVLTALTPPSSQDVARAVRELDAGNSKMSYLPPTTNPNAIISFWDVRREKGALERWVAFPEQPSPTLNVQTGNLVLGPVPCVAQGGGLGLRGGTGT